MIRIGGEFAGGPLYRYLGYQEASDLHANYREGTVADILFIGFRLCRRPLLTFDDLMLGWMDEQEYGILVKAPSREPID